MDTQETERNKKKSHLYIEKGLHQIPVIYRKEYNIKLFGFERLHPFDAGKWGNVVQLLKTKNLIEDDTLMRPNEASSEDLKSVHTSKYLNSLKWSVKVAQITEVPIAALVPNCFLQAKLLKPFRFQTGGSILGGLLAIEHGWAINIGGGFHHCSSNRGGGFCAYADITLTIKYAQEQSSNLERVMIIDLDAHQGNGHENDFMGRKDIYILDVYNNVIYPWDEYAKTAIRSRVELMPFTEDDIYLEAVERHVREALIEFDPQLVVYNAGTDVLIGDPLGLLKITAEGILKRDEIVWEKTRERNIPILMLTSGGYQSKTAAVIADSIANLHNKQIISLKIC